MNKLHTFLKIKHTSLAAEARLIKNEEIKLKKRTEYLRSKQRNDSIAEELLDERMELRHHRKAIVSFECRAAHLALAYLKGKPYKSVETFSKVGWKNNFYSCGALLSRVADLVAKYENIQAYRWKEHRRPRHEVGQLIYNWMFKGQC